MDFALSDEQLALADAARALLDDLADPVRVRAAAEAGGVDRELWSVMVDQGWTAVTVPEAEGGLGLGAVDAAVLAEQVGAHVAPAPFLSTVVAVDALRRAGASGVAGAGELVEGLVAGRVVGCVSVDADSVTAADGRLTGRPAPVVDAPVASVAIVAAREGDEVGLHAVDLDAVGRPRAQPAMDRTRPAGWLELDATPALRLGDSVACSWVADACAVYASAEMLGAAQRVLDMTVDHAKDRVQFGRPIGSFQAVKHRCADMLVDVEGMRSSAYWAAWCLGADDPDRSVAAATAQIWCSEASRRVMGSGLQVHGGIGFTWEHDLHLFLKRAQLDQVRFGDVSRHRQRLADLLRARVAAGESVV